MTQFRHLELNDGVVEVGEHYKLIIPKTASGYTDAQIDDYGLRLEDGERNGRTRYKWYPNTTLELKAKFSHPESQLKGTAGFGFWNAPFGDPTIKRPALPQAIWFFFGSPPNDLPFFAHKLGQGWIAATVNALSWKALRWAPFSPFVFALNHIPTFKKAVWPKVQSDLGICAKQLQLDLTEWHHYRLHWGQSSCQFWVDDSLILTSPTSPKGPLGFVCWIDNQYMVLRENGRFCFGTLPINIPQWLKIKNLKIS